MPRTADNMELLAPAQGPEQLALALHFGADAVYAAAPRWGMRAGARNFSEDELAAGVAAAHEAGACLHLTLNTVMRDADADVLPAFLERIDAMGVDAAIVADLGMMALVRRYAPHVELHVSTQASVMSAETARAYAALGARRIVLAREMSLAQIAQVRARLSREVELEVFAHGSMCMAYSGRCLLSAGLMGAARSAISGACAQPCRWGWHLVEDRSGAEVPLVEEDGASYLLSSDDLCLIDYLDDLREAGVDAIKLEGRSKGSYYTACVTNAYRQVLDGGSAAAWRAELDLVSHRPYSTGFLLGEPAPVGASGYQRDRTMVAIVRSCERMGEGWIAQVTCRNKAEVGAVVQVLSPGHEVRAFALGQVELRGEDGQWSKADSLFRNGATYRLSVPFELAPLDLLCR